MTPLRRQTFSVQVAVADASGWLRDKATKFKHKHVDFTWIAELLQSCPTLLEKKS